MHDYQELFQQARDLLEREAAPSKQTLLAAAKLFWDAYKDADKWDQQAGEDAKAILEQILHAGSIQGTIQQMDDAGVMEASETLLHFCRRYAD